MSLAFNDSLVCDGIFDLPATQLETGAGLELAQRVWGQENLRSVFRDFNWSGETEVMLGHRFSSLNHVNQLTLITN